MQFGRKSKEFAGLMKSFEFRVSGFEFFGT